VNSRILIAVCAFCCTVGAPLGLTASESINPLDQAEVILRVRDGRWVDREATRFAAAYGGDLASLRGELARVLFRCRSFDGIDLSRPSMIAWRPGNMPLLAVIPVTNRVAFLKSFGAVDSEEPPLVRTGERDGTVIYRQNQPGGEWEYRLLVAGNVAYLARTSDECQRLASLIGQPANDPAAPPIEIQMRGNAILHPSLPGAGALNGMPGLPLDLDELTTIPGIVSHAWEPMADQIATISMQARSDTQGNLLCSARLIAKPDSTLAAWIATQRPGTERLAGQLRTQDTAMLVTGRLVFQGQAERWAFDQAETLRAAGGKGWNDAADGSYRGLCTLIERTGAFAISVERSSNGLVQNWVAEHPRAIEVVQSIASVVGALRAAEPELVRIGQRSAFTLPAAGGTSLFVAGDRHATRLDDHGAKRTVAAATNLLQRLENAGSLDAAPALMAIWIDLGLAWNAPPPIDGTKPEQVVIHGALRPAGTSTLDLSIDIPLAGVGRLLGRMNKTTKND
jgi:hypothetical protein